MDKFTIVLFFLGIILTIIGYYENQKSNISSKVEYKFIDKTLEEAQKDTQIPPHKLFKDMFTEAPIIV